MILAMYDVSGIQEYIFQSNRLRENIGASRIVGEILKKYLPEILEKRFKEKGGLIADWRREEQFFFLSNPFVKAEVIYIGGGNALIAYRDENDYNAVNEELAMCLLEKSHSLYLAVAAIESDGSDFVRDKELLENRMNRIKRQMMRPRPPGAFPVSEQDSHSGLPITEYSPDVKRNVTRLQRVKLDAASAEEKREPVPFPVDPSSGFSKWAFHMRELIRGRDEDSYVAIVHLDGNGMGDQLRRRLAKLQGVPYADAVQEMRKMSMQISDGYKHVFDQMILSLMDAVPTQYWEKETEVLPIRPLIMDGDDLTFLCLGAWGVPLAARLLEMLEQESRNGGEDRLALSACAGVALVHSHFPFHIGYEVAEACCKRAKTVRVEEGAKGAYLDFELVRGSLPEMSGKGRRRGGPYRIGGDAEGKSAAFSELAACLKKISDSDWPNWRLERLYSALRGDGEQLEFFLREAGSRGYKLEQILPEKAQQPLSGADRKLLLDALDLLPLFDWNVWTFGKEGAE